MENSAFREAISHFATGVTVVTTVHDGRPAGMTASAVCSLSLDPVLLLVCVDNRLPTHTAIELMFDDAELDVRPTAVG
jgi:flavin reductase (DIM6/NTAB) family NADH-FMN oxidoreductase RutF